MYDRRETSKLSSEKFSEYCKLLGIDDVDQLTVDEINRKFRRLAINYHPDKVKDDEVALNKFQMLLNARDALVVHVQLYGIKKDNSAETNNFSKRNETKKAWSMPDSGMSLDAVLDYSYHLISGISGIQRRLLTTLIDVITEKTELNKFPFKRVFSAIEQVKFDINHAVDSKGEHEQAASVIIQLINHIKDLLTEIEKLQKLEDKSTSLVVRDSGLENAFQSSLDHLQSKLLRIKKRMMELFCEFIVDEDLSTNHWDKNGYQAKNDKYENDKFVLWCYKKEDEDEWYISGHNDNEKRILKNLGKVKKDELDLYVVAEQIGRTLVVENSFIKIQDFLALTDKVNEKDSKIIKTIANVESETTKLLTNTIQNPVTNNRPLDQKTKQLNEWHQTWKYQRERQNFEDIWNDPKHFSREDKIKAILNDYTKFNSGLLRFFTLHWDRNHIADLHAIYEASEGKNANQLLQELKAIKLVNPKGTCATLREFIEEQLIEPKDTPVLYSNSI